MSLSFLDISAPGKLSAHLEKSRIHSASVSTCPLEGRDSEAGRSRIARKSPFAGMTEGRSRNRSSIAAILDPKIGVAGRILGWNDPQTRAPGLLAEEKRRKSRMSRESSEGRRGRHPLTNPADRFRADLDAWAGQDALPRARHAATTSGRTLTPREALPPESRKASRHRPLPGPRPACRKPGSSAPRREAVSSSSIRLRASASVSPSV